MNNLGVALRAGLSTTIFAHASQRIFVLIPNAKSRERQIPFVYETYCLRRSTIINYSLLTIH